MTKLSRRVDALEVKISKPDITAAWIAARELGLYLDFDTLEPVTFDELQRRAPLRAERIAAVLALDEDG